MEAAHTHRSGDVYKITKEICGKTNKQISAIRDKNETLLTNEKMIRERFKEHFEDVLNQDLIEP